MTGRLEKPIFMIGMPRSGTTVLSESIAVHADLGWLSNYLNKFPDLTWLSLLNRMTSIPGIGWYLHGKKKQQPGFSAFLRQLLPYSQEAFSIWERCFGTHFSYDYLIRQSPAPTDRIRATAYMDRALKFQNKHRLFTKLTGPPRIFFLLKTFPDASFIHVVRDPRAVISSLLKIDFWNSGNGAFNPWWKNGLPEDYVKIWKRYDTPAALAAIQWKRVVELTDEEKKKLAPDRYLEIRYEDFISKPDQILSMIFKKMALPDSAQAHRYLSSMGNLKNMNYKFKNNLSEQEIEAIEDITADLAAEKGYRFARHFD